jgi:hypothetical protein
MFGLFKSAKQKRLEQSAERAEICCSLLRIQMEWDGEDGKTEFQARLHTPFAYGYLFGFSDGFLITRKVDDDSERLGDIAATFVFLFGKDRGLKAFDQCMADQSHEQFVRGRLCGGQEALEWRNSHGELTPTGLIHYVLNQG